MDTQTKYVIGIVAAVVVLIGVFAFINQKINGGDSNGVDLTSFAQCLKNNGTIMYGAFWCPHCQATKRMFGSAAKDLPYHECSTPDGNSQLPDCTAQGVKGYPTWVFPDSTRLEGETTLQTLSERSGCPLPAGVATDTTTTTGQSSSVATTTASTTAH